MRTPRSDIVRILTRAAALRVAASSWERIGAGVRRHPATLRRWRREFPELWAELFDEAVQERCHESEAESIRSLRELLRSKDEKLRRDAARDLLAFLHRRERNTRPKESGDPLAQCSYAELTAMVAAALPGAGDPDHSSASSDCASSN